MFCFRKFFIVIGFGLFFLSFYILRMVQELFHFLLFLLAIRNTFKYLFPFRTLYSQNSVPKSVAYFCVFVVLKDFIPCAWSYCNEVQCLLGEDMRIFTVFSNVYTVGVSTKTVKTWPGMCEDAKTLKNMTVEQIL